MPDRDKKIDLTVRVNLWESEGNALPDDLPGHCQVAGTGLSLLGHPKSGGQLG